MIKRLTIFFGLSLSLFSFNQLLADEVKKEADTVKPATTSDKKDEVKTEAKAKEEEEEEEEEEDVAQADIISQQRVNDQFRSAQPSGMIDSYRTGNQGPIRTDGYYDDESQNYYRRQQERQSRQ